MRQSQPRRRLKSVLDVASPRARASIALMAFSGLRPQVLGNADASDGLKLGDLPELTIDGDKKKISFAIMPTIIVVRAALSKTRNKYITFLPKEGCEYVLGYLRKRISDGESLHGDSPLIALKKGYEHKGNFKRSQHYKEHHNQQTAYNTTNNSGDQRDNMERYKGCAHMFCELILTRSCCLQKAMAR